MKVQVFFISQSLFTTFKYSQRSQVPSSFNLKCGLAGQKKTLGKNKSLQEQGPKNDFFKNMIDLSNHDGTYFSLNLHCKPQRAQETHTNLDL